MMLRYVMSFIMAFWIVTLLFALMIALIKTSEVPVDKNANLNMVDFIRVKKDPSLNLEDIKPEPPPEPAKPPPPPAALAVESIQTSNQSFAISEQPNLDSFSIEPGFSAGEGDGDYLPIYRVPPQYPRQALLDRAEGWVIVEFTIDVKGNVKNPRVVKSEPAEIFDAAALNAVKRFRFKPRSLGGTPIEVNGVRNRIRFRLKS